jgi:hypothetical protein
MANNTYESAEQEIADLLQKNEIEFNNIKNKYALVIKDSYISKMYKSYIDNRDLSNILVCINLLTTHYMYISPDLDTQINIPFIFSSIRTINYNTYRLNHLCRETAYHIPLNEIMSDGEIEFHLRKFQLVDYMKMKYYTKEDYDRIKTKDDFAQKKNEMQGQKITTKAYPVYT